MSDYERAARNLIEKGSPLDCFIREGADADKVIAEQHQRIEALYRRALEQDVFEASWKKERHVMRDRIEELEAELSKFQESKFHPDWSMLEATRESLREHQKLGIEQQGRIEELERQWDYLRDQVSQGASIDYIKGFIGKQKGGAGSR